MARDLTTNPQIDAFIRKVIIDANHHASNVANVIMPLSQAVRARLTLGIDTVEVFERSGVIGRTCWVTIGGRRYCFTYRHRSDKIELRNGSTQGSLRYAFDNSTSMAAIKTQVAAL